jgi:hypothetical protein
MKSGRKTGSLDIGGNKGKCPKTSADSGPLKGDRAKSDADLTF